MLVTLEGMTYDSIFLFLKEIILLLPLQNKTSSSKIKFGDKHSNLPFQSANGFPFKQITLLGMDKYCNEAQLLKAPLPMLVTLSGMTMLERKPPPKCTFTNASNTRRDDYARERTTTRKCPITNASNTSRNDYTRE